MSEINHFERKLLTDIISLIIGMIIQISLELCVIEFEMIFK